MNFNSKTQQYLDISFGALTGTLIGLIIMTIIFSNDVEVLPLLVLAFIYAGFYSFFKNKNSKSHDTIDLYNVTRVEVIDNKERSYVKYCDKNEVQASMQDKSMTLKIFINKKMEDKELALTERQIAYFREQLSRIIRQVELIERDQTFTEVNKNRLSIIVKCATKVDEECKTL